MCHCTPEIRTPFCGRFGCVWPKSEGVKKDWSQTTGIEISPEYAQRLQEMWRRAQEEAAIKQRSVLQYGTKQPEGERVQRAACSVQGDKEPSARCALHAAPVQFRENGTAIVKGVLFTPRDAARMLLTIRLSCRPDQVTDDSIDLFLADL